MKAINAHPVRYSDEDKMGCYIAVAVSLNVRWHVGPGAGRRRVESDGRISVTFS
jgi:hypothetical protein